MALIPPDWRPVPATLVFVERGGEVLLIRKKRGHGAGKVNAPGGRLEAAETPAACARRELREETGLCCGALMPVAYLRFHDREDRGDRAHAYDVRGFAFRAATFEGVARETPEAAPFWCAWDAVPYGEMWAADRYWIPSVGAGRPVRGDFVFEGERLVCSAVAPVQAAGMPRFRADFGVTRKALIKSFPSAAQGCAAKFDGASH